MNVVEIPAEKLAMAFKQTTSTETELVFETVEDEIREAFKQAGLDDNVWVRKIEKGFKLESVEQLRNVTEEQLEVFLKPISTPTQMVLRKILEKVIKVNIAKRNVKEKSHARSTDVTAAEAVRTIEGGVLCRGIFLCENTKQLVQERKMVIDVNENLDFRATRSVHEILHNEFTFDHIMQTFVNHLDKHLSERSASIGVNMWGVSLEKAIANSMKGSSVCETGNYISSVHYQIIPVTTVHISPNDIRLRAEVITELQGIEKSLKRRGYKAEDHFKDFFKTYGTHISHGTIEFGGTLVSVAYCQDFKEKDRKRITATVMEASEAALLLGFNRNINPGQPLSAYEVLGRGATGMDAEDLKNITVVVKKIGGSRNVAEKEEWKETLRDNCKEWAVVQRASQPKPMWKMLLSHKDDFEDYLALSNVMQEEWKHIICAHFPQSEESLDNRRTTNGAQGEECTNPGEETSEPQTQTQIQRAAIRIMEEEKQRSDLRHEIQLWIEHFRYLNPQNVATGTATLASLRKKYDKIRWKWQSEILYLRDVQIRLIWTTRLMCKTTDPTIRMQLAAALKHILSPLEEINIEHFQNIREITESLKEIEGNNDRSFAMVDDLRNLTTVLKESLEQGRRRGIHLIELQERIEFIIKTSSSSPSRGLEHILCLAVLQLFGFNPYSLIFDHLLEEEDIKNMRQQLETHFRNFDSVPNNLDLQQVYILRVGLSGLQLKEDVVSYMLNEMPGGICKELKEMYCNENTVNLEKLQLAVDRMLQNASLELDLHSLGHALKSQLFEHQQERKQNMGTEIRENVVDKKIETILQAVDMVKYFPQQLTYEDVIMLGADVYNDVNKKPSSLRELPWYFMKHIIGLDSDTRENCHVVGSLDNESGDDDDSDIDEDDESLSRIHPLDLILVIFLCADDFLRQELAEKMAKCQYAVPFILPSINLGSQNLILHWALKSVSRTFYNKNNVINRTLVDAEAPLVACMNIGDETSWKGRLLNKLLSPQQETFWHQGLKRRKLQTNYFTRNG